MPDWQAVSRKAFKWESERERERGRTYVNGAVGVAIVVGLAQIGYGSVG